MYEQIEKPKENKRRVATNSVAQKKNGGKQGLAFVDNRNKNTTWYKKTELSKGNVPIQRAVKYENNEYSFQGTYDLNGNPFLKSKDGKAQAPKTIKFLPSVEIPKNNMMEAPSMISELNDNNYEAIMDNAKYGRDQILKSGDKTAILEMGRTYVYGAERDWEPAMRPLDKRGQGPSYEKVKDDMAREIYDIGIMDGNKQERKNKYTDKVLNAFGYLDILVLAAEGYRADDIPEYYETLKNDAVEEIVAELNKQKHKSVKALPKDILEIINKVTTDEIWAGSKSKLAMRKDDARLHKIKYGGITLKNKMEEEKYEQINHNNQDGNKTINTHNINSDKKNFNNLFV